MCIIGWQEKKNESKEKCSLCVQLPLHKLKKRNLQQLNLQPLCIQKYQLTFVHVSNRHECRPFSGFAPPVLLIPVLFPCTPFNLS